MTGSLSPDPARVCALIVGIEEYAAGPGWELPGPARDAVRFRSWLLRAGVPERNVLTHLAPLPGHHPGVPYRPADHESLRRALVRELPRLDGEVLWIWWGGHGVLDASEELRLFSADATTADKRNIGLEAARRALAGETLPGFERQLWVIDACQTFAETHGFRHTLPADSLPAGPRALARAQLLLLAATRGQRAANDPARATGLFSDALLAELGDGPGDLWPADPEAFAARLRARMAALRESGHTGQTPAFSFHSPQRTETAPPATPVAGRLPGGLPALIGTLLAYPLMSDREARQAMVDALGTPAVERMPRHAAPRPDLVGIVQTLRREEDGLWLLHDAVTALDGDPGRAAALHTVVTQLAGPRRESA